MFLSADSRGTRSVTAGRSRGAKRWPFDSSMATGSRPLAWSCESFFSTSVWNNMVAAFHRFAPPDSVWQQTFFAMYFLQITHLGGLLPHGDELLGRGRVDANGGVELRLGGAELHGDGDALDDFSGVGAEHVRAHDALRGGVDDQLHENALLAVSHGVLERAEGGLVDVHLAAACARAFLRQAHSGDRRVG